ncbi:Ovate protein family, C-terminal [Sesbania bispinosa]|nr:Ovate protein family, C-terminal [Sesbania bispinosa]
MPKKIQKTLQDYLFKIKKPHPPQIQLPFNSKSKSWILSGCKHPKTPSFALDDRNNHKVDDAATLADVDRFLFENFRSLYLKDDEEPENYKRVSEESHNDEEIPLPDLCGSTRFFVKPGMSGSLLEDAMTITSDEAGSSSTSITTLNDSCSLKEDMNNNNNHIHTLPDNCVALLTYSMSPYEEFRRSMQEMVEARTKYGEGVIDWDFMEELLFCYLNLNEKKSHKYILSAFVDLITVMRRNSETDSVKPRSVRTIRIGGEVRKKNNAGRGSRKGRP